VPTVDAVFSDYDGTLTSMVTDRRHSRIPPSLDAALRSLAEVIPFAVITSKDYAFIRRRTPYAQAWACVCGLDIRLAHGRSFTTDPPFDLEGPLRVAMSELSGDNCRFEEKRDGLGRLLGFSIDWRGGATPRLIGSVSERLVTMGCHVRRQPGEPYLDAFASEPDKGAALVALKALLGVSGPVLFLGDSVMDNSAFDAADFAFCVDHGQQVGEIRAEAFLAPSDMPKFVGALRAKAADRQLARSIGGR